jgi:hypothetical protein
VTSSSSPDTRCSAPWQPECSGGVAIF